LFFFFSYLVRCVVCGLLMGGGGGGALGLGKIVWVGVGGLFNCVSV